MTPRFSNHEGGNWKASHEKLQENLSTRPNLEGQFSEVEGQQWTSAARTVTKIGRKSVGSCSVAFFFQ
jgi:hypothetical protein